MAAKMPSGPLLHGLSHLCEVRPKSTFPISLSRRIKTLRDFCSVLFAQFLPSFKADSRKQTESPVHIHRKLLIKARCCSGFVSVQSKKFILEVFKSDFFGVCFHIFILKNGYQ